MNFFAVISFISSYIAFFLGFFILLKNPKDKKNRAYFYLTLITGFVTFFEFQLRIAETYEMAVFWLKAMSFWPFSMSFILHFISCYIEGRKFINSKGFIYGIHFTAAIVSSLLLFSKIPIAQPIEANWGWKVVNNMNFVFIIITIWSTIVSAFILYISIINYTDNSDEILKKQAKHILIGFSFIISVSILTYAVFPSLSLNIPELTNTATIAAYILVAYAIYKYKLFILNPAAAAENIVENISGSLLLTDSTGLIVFTNNAAEDIFGIKKDLLIGYPISKLFKNETLQNGSDRIITNIKFSESYIRHDEYILLLNINRICVRDEFKKIQGFVYLINEFDEGRQGTSKGAHEDKKDSLKSEFIFSLYEEIRSPLNVILNYAENLIRSDLMDFERKNYIKAIEKYGINLYRLIGKITEIIKIGDKQLQLNINRHDINRLINNIVTSNNEFINDRKIKILVVETLYNSNSNILIDKEKIEKILELILELLINHTKKGIIKIGYFEENKNILHFYVSSDKLEISNKNLAKSLKLLKSKNYMQLRIYGLPGLNLAIVKSYIEVLEGLIWTETKEDSFQINIQIPYKP